MQRRGQDFFMGTLRPFKGTHAPPVGGPGAKAPRMVAKFPFLKRFKVLENESIFQKKIFLPENPFFQRKNSKIELISQEFLSVLKNYLKF